MTGQIAEYFQDRGMTSYVLRMHGNELRKANLRGAAVQRLCRATATTPDDNAQAASAAPSPSPFRVVRSEKEPPKVRPSVSECRSTHRAQRWLLPAGVPSQESYRTQRR